MLALSGALSIGVTDALLDSSKYFRWETLHAPENIPEVRLILRVLSLPNTYDAFQQTL